MISDGDFTYVQKDYASGKEGCIHVIDINGTKCVLKQFKKTKSENRVRREADFQLAAWNAGVAPEPFAIDLRAKRIFMCGIESRLVDIAKQRNPPALTANEQLQIVLCMKKLDSIGILHNDGNCLNVMCQLENGSNRIYIIDYGMAKQIDKKVLRKSNTPNLSYTLEMMKKSFRHHGIKAWDNMSKR